MLDLKWRAMLIRFTRSEDLQINFKWRAMGTFATKVRVPGLGRLDKGIVKVPNPSVKVMPNVRFLRSARCVLRVACQFGWTRSIFPPLVGGVDVG